MGDTLRPPTSIPPPMGVNEDWSQELAPPTVPPDSLGRFEVGEVLRSTGNPEGSAEPAEPDTQAEIRAFLDGVFGQRMTD